MWTVVQRIGELNNYDPGITKGVADPYGKFLDLAEIFRRMQSRGDIFRPGVIKEFTAKIDRFYKVGERIATAN